MRKIETVELTNGLKFQVNAKHVVLMNFGEEDYITHSEFREFVDWAYDQMNKIENQVEKYPTGAGYDNQFAKPSEKVIELGYDARPIPTADALATRSAGGPAAVEALKLGDSNKAYQGVPKEMKLEAVDLAAVARRGAIVESMVKRA